MIQKLALTFLFCTFVSFAFAQQHDSLTWNDYSHAEGFMGYNAEKYIDHGAVYPHWLPGDKFWYRTLVANGSEFIWVDPAKGIRKEAFDQERLAKSIADVTGKHYMAAMLPFEFFDYTDDGKAIIFQADHQQWKCDLKNYRCEPDTADHLTSGYNGRYHFGEMDDEVVSPDGSKAAFIKDYNLWVRNIKTGQLTQLTTDGIKNFGYATDNAGWRGSDRPIILWSPDSKKIATFKQDQRNVGNMYLVSTQVGHPELKEWKYPLPGDSTIIMIHRCIINVDTPKVIFLKVPPDPHRSTYYDDISNDGILVDVAWSPDASHLAFVSTSRDHKHEKFRIANAETGNVREVFEETVATEYQSGYGGVNWRYLPESNDIIWYSERDNWGHLYLYDATTGQLKNQITKGDWVVNNILKVDDKNRWIYFIADGREPENPYFDQFYRVNFDGTGLTLLTPEDGSHDISLSPSGDYFIDSYSKPNVPPVTVLRSINGKLIATLEKTDISRLVAQGWKPPVPVTVKAHDGVTDLYGLMYTPTNLDPHKKYPVIDYIYPGPQAGSVNATGGFKFMAARGDDQSLAELGFVVVLIEGTSNPLRSQSFQDMDYGNMAENTLSDQVAGIRQLAARYPFMDTTRIGIWGHSGGGFATAAALFRYPNFFKVGIAESGNHDNRNYEDDWGERYIGLLKKYANGTDNYTSQANETYAKNLQGKLMLADGLMDNNVPPSNTLLVVQALEEANKDYDLVIFPNSPHGYGRYSLYMMRRRWDYFVKNLLGKEPPKDFLMEIKRDPRNEVR